MSSSKINALYEKACSNAGFYANNSLAEAKDFHAAATELLIRRPEEVVIDGNRTKFDAASMRKLLDKAESFIASNDAKISGSPETHIYSMNDVRS